MSKPTTWPTRNGPPWPSKADVRNALRTEGTLNDAAKKLEITGYRLYAILDGETTTGRHLSEETRQRISRGVKRTEAERRARGETR
jgi:hypothetical protein